MQQQNDPILLCEVTMKSKNLEQSNPVKKKAFKERLKKMSGNLKKNPINLTTIKKLKIQVNSDFSKVKKPEFVVI